MEARVIWRPGRLTSSGGEFDNSQVGNSLLIATAEARTVFRENSPFSAGQPVNPAGRVSFSCQKFFLGLLSPAAPRRNPKPNSVPHRATFLHPLSRETENLADPICSYLTPSTKRSLNSIGSSTAVSTLFFVFSSPQPAFRLSVRRQSMPLGRNSIR